MNVFAQSHLDQAFGIRLIHGLEGVGRFLNAFDSEKKAPSKVDIFAQAIKNGKIDQVKELIESNVEYRSDLERMILYGALLATRLKENDIAKLILSKAAELEIRPYTFEGPAWYIANVAIESNNYDILQDLLQSDLSNNTDFLGIASCKEDFTPLKEAFKKNNEAAIKLLLSQGADFKCALDDEKVAGIVGRNYSLRSFLVQLDNPTDEVEELAKDKCSITDLNIFEQAILSLNIGNKFDTTHRCYRREVFNLIAGAEVSGGDDRSAAYSIDSKSTTLLKPSEKSGTGSHQ